MTIIKVFNNNCVAVLHLGSELIVTGSGIGFQMKAGQDIDQSKIEKSFKIVDHEMVYFENLIAKIDVSYFETTLEIVEYASSQLNSIFNDSVNLNLTDHISYAISRFHEGIEMPGLFNDELRIFYPEEFVVGEWARSFINHKHGVNIPSNEASLIAVHLINAKQGRQSHHAQNMIRFIKDIFSILSSELGIDQENDSMHFQRMMVHIRFLGNRVFGSKVDASHMDDADLQFMMSGKVGKYRHVVSKITHYIQGQYKYHLSLEEQLYLSIHLFQIMKEHQKRAIAR